MYKERYESGMVDWWYKWMENRTGHYPQAISRKDDDFNSFINFIKNEIEAIEKGTAIEGEILSKGKYSKGIEVFKNQFKDNFHVVKNEELNNNTINELEEISNFLGIPDYDWSRFKDTKIFKGNYPPNKEDQSVKILNNFYKESNEELFSLTGIDYRK